jgi:hypothetical protein
MHEQYAAYIKVSKLGDAYIFVYRYWGHPLLLVQVNTENIRIRIFYVFTHLMMDSNA